MEQIKNREIYKMYKGKMCMRHTIEIFTPISDGELGWKMVCGQLDKSEAHKQAMEDINYKIQEVLGDNLNVDIGKINTFVQMGKAFEE